METRALRMQSKGQSQIPRIIIANIVGASCCNGPYANGYEKKTNRGLETIGSALLTTNCIRVLLRHGEPLWFADTLFTEEWESKSLYQIVCDVICQLRDSTGALMDWRDSITDDWLPWPVHSSLA